jgi:hypothetical protein
MAVTLRRTPEPTPSVALPFDMSPAPTADEELRALRARLDELEGIDTGAARPGSAAEGRFQGYVAMRADGQGAVERLLSRLGEPFWAIFHVGEQKCELGFRVEVTTSQDALRYDLRFWGCPEWGLHRIRRFLARRVAGDADRDALPSLEPPEQAAPDQ